MSDEARNVFERKAPRTTLADDQKNRFTRHQEVVDAQRRDTTAHDTRLERRTKKAAAWTHQSGTPVTASGVHLDPETARLKAPVDADRTARRTQTAATPVTSGRTLQALIEFWKRNAKSAVNFYESEFNYVSLSNCLVTLIFGRQRPAIAETVAEAYFECAEGNHLELPRRVDGSGATIRKRGEPAPIPPTLYQAYVWPAEAEAARRDELEKSMADWLAGKKLAQARPFAELQAEVRGGYKAPKTGAPNLDRS